MMMFLNLTMKNHKQQYLIKHKSVVRVSQELKALLKVLILKIMLRLEFQLNIGTMMMVWVGHLLKVKYVVNNQ